MLVDRYGLYGTPLHSTTSLSYQLHSSVSPCHFLLLFDSFKGHTHLFDQIQVSSITKLACPGILLVAILSLVEELLGVYDTILRTLMCWVWTSSRGSSDVG